MSHSWKLIIDFIVLAILYKVVFLSKWKTQGKRRLIVNSLMYLYISLVLYVTLMPVIASLPDLFNHPYSPMNRMPFDDYIFGRGDALRQIILNIIMMMPFGFLLPLVKKQNLVSCIFWTFLLSLGIELIQPLINGSRSGDITDIITNTTGGLLGYLLHSLLRPFIRKLLSYIE